ncbi:MAG: HlyD family type I secretion periplasmic adaptor subunit [Thiobacillus sp.]
MENAGVKTLSRDALDFAPGLLSIQESPPAKLPRTVLYSVAVLFGILLVWAIVGKLDIVASAEGRLVPQTYVKIVQPADSGIIQDILVREGQPVEANQMLMRMDGRFAEADARAIQNELALKALQLRRIDAELTGSPMIRAAHEASDLYTRVEAQYYAHRQSFLDAIAQESAALDKARYELRSAEEVVDKLQRVIPSYRNSAEAYQKLAEQGFVSPLARDEKERDRIEKEQDLRAQVSNAASLKASIQASQKRLAQIGSNYRSELQNERIETEAQYLKVREEWEKASHKTSLLELRAPQAGIIKDLATHTRGTVVSPGTVLMTIVPQEDPLQAEVLIKNEDVGFVHVGQSVKVKLSAYPFQKYGMIDGIVTHVGPDTAEGSNAPPELGKESPPLPGLRYKALVKLNTQYLATDDRKMRLTAGMEAVVEIHQGRRTVMEYLLSPVQKAWQEAGRER